MIEGTLLRFRCRLTSPFHTARQEYPSLRKGAPFVPGSTLRGAVLAYLIALHCPEERMSALRERREPEEVRRFHLECSADCPVRPFFADPPTVRFSFGHFEGEWRFQRLTRIALERSGGSVASGAFLNAEAVEAGAEFTFEVILTSGGPTPETVEAGVRGASEMGIGGLRSIGLGRFAVLEVERRPLEEHLDGLYRQMPPIQGGEEVRWTFTTPYVLSGGHSPWTPDPQAIRRRLEAELAAVVRSVGVDLELPTFSRVDMALRPEFLARWSYERGCREFYLVAWPGSALTVVPDRPGDLERVLALAQAFGLGPASEWGFGRFSVTVEDGGALP